jgi:hypothetical protein
MRGKRGAFLAMAVVVGVVAVALMAARSQAARRETGPDMPLVEYDM